MTAILIFRYTLEVYKEFLSRNNNADKLILNTTKDIIPKSSVYHSALVMSNALMYAGTTQDPFLRYAALLCIFSCNLSSSPPPPQKKGVEVGSRRGGG